MSRRLLVGVFGTEDGILGATKAARSGGYEIVDVFTPYAVHGLDVVQGIKRTKIGLVCLALGLTGAIAKLGFQIWTSAWDWPVNVGGKPLVSLPAFVPVTFEVTVLFAGVGTVLAFLFRSKLLPGRKPKLVFDRVSNDRFVLVLEQTDAAFDVNKIREMFKRFDLLSIEEREEAN